MKTGQSGLTKPNFFILGAAKSGSSSLYRHLSSHPEIFLPTLKEPTFFCQSFQKVSNIVDYFKLFEAATDQPMIGEASTAYLSDPDSPRLIHAFFPDARFLVILRNPADRAYSLFNHMRRHRHETTRHFRSALQKEEERFHSERFRGRIRHYLYNFMYFQSGLYGEQLQRYLQFYPRSRFHITTLKRLRKDLQGEMDQICDFLEISRREFRTKIRDNTGIHIRSVYLERLLIRPLFGRAGRVLSKIVNRTKRHKIDPQIRAELMNRYRSDLQLLFELTGVDLRNS